MKHSAIRKLIWKELRENASGTALGIFILCGFTGVALHSRIIPDSEVLIFCAMMAVVLSVFFAMWPIAGDRREGTIGLLLSLPIHPWKILMIKALVTAVLLTLPILMALTMFVVIAGDREASTEFMFRFFKFLSPICVGVYLWVLCLGVRQPSEARVGLVGMGVILGGGGLIGLLAEWDTSFAVAIIRCTPLGCMEFLERRSITTTQLVQIIAGNAVTLTLMISWAMWRFSKLSRTKG